MSLETNDPILFGGTSGNNEELDSMAPNTTSSQPYATEAERVGFSGVGESLFDRIRARTLEQQKQKVDNPQLASANTTAQVAAEPSQQLLTAPTLEMENAFDAAVGRSSGGNGENAPFSNRNENSNETTYSFASSGGEDFSRISPQVPTYGQSRDDPYFAANGGNSDYHVSLQDKTTAALTSTGEAMKSLFNKGLNGAQTFMTTAQDNMNGGGVRQEYANNFLLRDDNESGMPATMPQPVPPPPVNETAATSDQAYSMLQYGKTFVEDVFAFVIQLPPWGKGLLGLFVLLIAFHLFHK